MHGHARLRAAARASEGCRGPCLRSVLRGRCIDPQHAPRERSCSTVRTALHAVASENGHPPHTAFLQIETSTPQLAERRAGGAAYRAGDPRRALEHYARARAVVEFVRGASNDDQSEVDRCLARVLWNEAAARMALEEWAAAAAAVSYTHLAGRPPAPAAPPTHRGGGGGGGGGWGAAPACVEATRVLRAWMAWRCGGRAPRVRIGGGCRPVKVGGG